MSPSLSRTGIRTSLSTSPLPARSSSSRSLACLSMPFLVVHPCGRPTSLPSPRWCGGSWPLPTPLPLSPLPTCSPCPPLPSLALPISLVPLASLSVSPSSCLPPTSSPPPSLCCTPSRSALLHLFLCTPPPLMSCLSPSPISIPCLGSPSRICLLSRPPTCSSLPLHAMVHIPLSPSSFSYTSILLLSSWRVPLLLPLPPPPFSTLPLPLAPSTMSR